MKSSDPRVKKFQSLPINAMPSIRYADDDDAWIHHPADAIIEAQRTGLTCEQVAGSSVEISADRDGWREWETIE